MVVLGVKEGRGRRRGHRKSEKNKQVEAFVHSVIYTSIILLR